MPVKQNFMKTIIYIGIILLMINSAASVAQVAINEDGSPPDPSAMLDVQATDKGVLLPRLDFLDRPDPAAPGLMIFVTANGPQGDNLIYLYNGADWVMLNSTNTLVGSMTEGGVVFWYDQIQGFGLVSALFDQGSAEWGCFGTLIGPDAWNTEIGMGEVNTGAIVNGCTQLNIAAKLCDDLELNGYSDWFLPSRDELYEMYAQKTLIGGFTNNIYWSSTESEFAVLPEEAAWVVSMSNGTQAWTAKSVSLPVRCIRKIYF
jgi:hypothetical protein